MQMLKFKAECPYETGDRARFEKGGWYKLDTDLHAAGVPRTQ